MDERLTDAEAAVPHVAAAEERARLRSLVRQMWAVRVVVGAAVISLVVWLVVQRGA